MMSDKICQICKSEKASTLKTSPRNPKVVFHVCSACAKAFRNHVGK